MARQPDQDKPVTITRGDAQRLGRNQRYYDHRPRNSVLERAKYPVGVGAGNVKLGLAPGGGIASGTRASPTSGTVTLQVADQSTAALSNGTETVTAYNTLGFAIGASKLVVICRYQSFWYVIGTVC